MIHPESVRVLVVDDEEAFRYMLNTLLTAEAYKTDLAADGTEAINKLQQTEYDIVLLDILMPRIDGMEVLKFSKDKWPDTQVIMLTGLQEIQIAVQCIKMDAFDYVMKPYSSDELLSAIERAYERRQLRLENKLMRHELARVTAPTDLIGESMALKGVLDIAQKVAPSDTTVLIQGGSGTGKEVIANFIWKNSPRANKPFIVVNCASIPDTLIESELFGHEKGAFTDAHATKQGIVEIANGGTLLLDEVGDVSPLIQPKLLRFVETGEYRRVGSNTVSHSDVRIISATNKNLVEEVQRGKFREDLLYRLNVITLSVPALRDRREDIPLLADYFLKNRVRMRVQKSLSRAAMRVLLDYDWPGNVRELENVIERAAVLSQGEEIQVDDLALPLTSVATYPDSPYGRALADKLGTPISLKDVERVHIESVLRQLHWNKSATARSLGISLKTLYVKIQQYNIQQE